MGNQLVALAPSQIFPVENYFADISDTARYEASLGSTRFFKVARARTSTGLVVVKVFVIHDPSLPMRTYQEKLLELKNVLAPTFNCLPFQQAVLTERAGFLVRQYTKYSLYDRLSTRPFLTTIEKKWIAFQLLSALKQIHGLGVCHGDLKLENVMVTSWNWVLITDFAPFKPVYLPEDNPADYSYYFDTSRRRTCYIAPERFRSRGGVEPSGSSSSIAPPTGSTSSIAPPAGSSSSLASSNSASSQFLPDDGEDFLRGDALEPHMDVFSAGCAIVELFTEGVPPFDFSQLLSYRAGEYDLTKVLDKIEDTDMREMVRHMLNKSPRQRHSAEEYLRQARDTVFPEYFYSFLQSYMQMFSRAPLMSSDQKILRMFQDLSHINKMLTTNTDHAEKIDQDCLVLLTAVATSCVRSLHLTDSKLQALAVLVFLGSHQSSDIILDRILPFVIHFLKSRVAVVRVAAIHSVVSILQHVTTVPPSDANTFPEYVLPLLLPLCQDPATAVRAALAQQLATIAELAVKFLDLVTLGGPGATSAESSGPVPSYDTEVAALHELVGQAVTLLLEDQSNCVKQMVVHHGATRLAVFFGRQRANDVLLSHMITFLNDKEDSELRHCFYDNIAGVAAYVGWQCSPILKPLLQQGLADAEELVVARALSAMSGLTQQGLLERVALYEMLREAVPYLMHPNLWVRQAAAGMVAAAAERMDTVDVRVKVGSIVKPYLKQEVVQLQLPALVLGQLKEHIPRAVFDAVVRYNDVDGLFAVLAERQTARKISRGQMATQVVYPDMTPSMRHLFGRLAEAGMLPSVEDQLLGLQDYIKKLSGGRCGAGDSGVIDLSLVNVEKRVCRLVTEEPRLQVRQEEGGGSMTEEWQHMFGSGEVEARGEKRAPATVSRDRLVSPCQQELAELVKCKKQELALMTARQDNGGEEGQPGDGGGGGWRQGGLPWRPRGHLVAHLAEHRGGVVRLAAVPDTTLVASAATDGCVRVWDCARMEGRNVVNKARQMYNKHGGSGLTSVAATSHNRVIASSALNGSIYVCNIEKQSVVCSRQVDTDQDGTPLDLLFCDLSTSPVLFYGTTFGTVVGWDLRKPGDAVRFESELRNGLLTALAASGDESWLAAGTSNGVVGCWDLRFKLQVSSCQHPAKARVRRLADTGRPGCLLVSVQGNNEVGVWNLESGSRQQVLWASTAPPLAAAQASQHSACALLASGNCVVSGGTDCRLRWWDMATPTNSFVMACDSQPSYRTKLVDGTEVIQEVTGRGRGGRSEDGVTRLEAERCHTDWITDVVFCQTTQNLLVTGANDGVIKVWK